MTLSLIESAGEVRKAARRLQGALEGPPAQARGVGAALCAVYGQMVEEGVPTQFERLLNSFGG